MSRTPHRAMSFRRAVRAGLVLAIAATALVVVPSSAQAVIPTKPAQMWGTDGRVNIILPVGDRVVLGGEFTAVVDPSGNAYPAGNLAVIDPRTGAADLSWQGVSNGPVTAMTTANGVLYVGGSFSKVDGVARTRLAALDLLTGALTSWAPQADQAVDSLATAGGAVFAAGVFSTISDSTGAHPRAYLAKIDATTGDLDQQWAPAPGDRVRALTTSPDGSTIFIGGDFKTVNGSATMRSIAAFSTATPAVATAFRGTATNGTSFAPVYDLTTDGAVLYSAVGGAGGACTAMNAATGARLWTKKANGNLQSVRLSNGLVYCGGHFNGAKGFDGLTRNKIAAVQATAPYATTSFAPAIDSALGVWSVGVDPTHVYLGGDFTAVSGVPAPHFAEFVDSSAQTTPAAPTLSVTPGDSVLRLSWTLPSTDGGSSILRYRLFRKVGAGSYSKTPYAVIGSTLRSYDDTALVNGQQYTYYLQAMNSLGSGAPSNEVTGTPAPDVQNPPSVPLGLTLTSGPGRIDLTWSAPADAGSSPVVQYRVYRGTTSGLATLIASTDASVTAFTDLTASFGTTYFYSVAAVNSAGEGPRTDELSGTPGAGSPSAPVLSATVSGGVVRLSWTAPSDNGSPITKYVVARDGVRLVTVSASTLSYDDAGVASGASYLYQVRAVNAIGPGEYSNKVTVQVP